MKQVSYFWRVRTTLLVTLMALATFPIAPAVAQINHPGPSFSCAMADEASVEDMICADAALSRQDRVLATAFSQARATVRGTEGHGALLASQQVFLRQRAACMDLRTQKGFCVDSRVKERIELLWEWTRLKMDPARATDAGNTARKTGTSASSRPPRGPSFDCIKAITVVERAICNDRELSLLDRQMVDALRQANAGTGRSDLPVIATEQREFLANRNRCAARTRDRRICIQVAYENRIQRLAEFTDWARNEVN